ncbi:MAG: VOC family protein, partial [Methanobacterium sp.]
MPRVVHFEIPADDPERAIEFYKNVFGWKIDKWEGPFDY